jgi:hypothetical protein
MLCPASRRGVFAACKLTMCDDPESFDIPATAHAVAGDYDAAVAWQACAIEAHLAKNRGVGAIINVRKETT